MIIKQYKDDPAICDEAVFLQFYCFTGHIYHNRPELGVYCTWDNSHATLFWIKI